MDTPRDRFGIAVAAVRDRMRSGRLVLGEQLRVSDLSADLRLSATPVREALARLAGEGLIEDRRGAGYFAWRLDAVDLAELYALQGAYLRAALDGAGGRPPKAEAVAPPALSGAPDDADLLGTSETRLLALIQRGRSLALRRAHLRLADLLAPARRVEGAVLSAVGAEWAALDAAARSPEPADLAAWIGRHQALRIAAAPAIVAAMRSAVSDPGRI